MPKEAVFEEICLIPAGNGEDCVGYIDDGSVSPCPQDFLVRDDGSVCILDSVKDRIIIFKDTFQMPRKTKENRSKTNHLSLRLRKLRKED